VAARLHAAHRHPGGQSGRDSFSHRLRLTAEDSIRIFASRLRNAALPNAIGISIVDSDENSIRGNFVAGNSSHGIEVKRADSNLITQNVVGHSASKIGNKGNGLHLTVADRNQVIQNQIGARSGFGLFLDNADQSKIQRNDIGGNDVHLSTGTTSNTVTGNYVGLVDGGFHGGNSGHGVLVDGGARSNRIGGLGAGEGNWIGYNHWSGIPISGSTTQQNVFEGNLTGAPINWGWQASSGHHGIGIYDDAHGNWLGWGNTIVSSQWSGIAIEGSDDNVVWLNSIGTNGAGVNWGDQYYGIFGNSSGNRIFANEIAYNGSKGGEAGVRIDGGLAGNPINANSIHDNARAGIELADAGTGMTMAPMTLPGLQPRVQPSLSTPLA
jgi:parallel beta-helix repeat protein